jgi:histidinol-phosphate aminotransferase
MQHMTSTLNRRTLLKTSGFALGASLLSSAAATDASAASHGRLIHLNLNENAFGPSPFVMQAIQGELAHI